jgi:hypothetical protein
VADSREFILPSWRGTWLWSGSFGWFLTAVWFGTGVNYGFGTEDPSWWLAPAVCIPLGVLFSLLSLRKMKHNKVILRGENVTLINGGTRHRLNVADVLKVKWTSASPPLMNSWSPNAQDVGLTVTINDGRVIEVDLRIPSWTERRLGRTKLEVALTHAVWMH